MLVEGGEGERDFSINHYQCTDALKYQIDYGMFGSEKVKVITDLLLHIFCGRHMKVISS